MRSTAGMIVPVYVWKNKDEKNANTAKVISLLILKRHYKEGKLHLGQVFYA